MFEELSYKELPGRQTHRDVYVYGFSRCTYCAAARRFLTDEGQGCKYVLLDAVPADTRKPVQRQLEAIYGARVVYPVLEVDGRFIFGFNAEVWRSALE